MYFSVRRLDKNVTNIRDGDLTLTAPAEAFMLFTDRTAWEDAMNTAGAGVLTTDTFDNDISNGGSITFDSGIVSTATGGLTTNRVLSGAYEGLLDTDGNVPPVFNTTTWAFPESIIGFGADFVGAATSEGLQVRGNFDRTGDEVVDFFDELGSPGTGFLGIVGEAPFSSITFQTRTDDSSLDLTEGWLINNLSFGAISDPQPVPEPASMLGLLAIGGVAVGSVLKKKTA